MQHISRREVKFARANGIDIAYQTFGDKDASPLILIMGLGSQMVLWDGEFCRQLAAGGYRVIRFDNRDAGLSTKSEGDPPDVMAIYAEALAGLLSYLRGQLVKRAEKSVGQLRALYAERVRALDAQFGPWLEDVQRLMKEGDPDVALVYRSIGVCLGYSLVHYADFYEVKHMLILGRCTSGRGGPLILDGARHVLKTEFPELADDPPAA